MKSQKAITVYYACVAAFGALIVGLNMGGISGAIGPITVEYYLSSLAKGLVTSSIMLGCLIGALLGGGMSDKCGRKPMLFASTILLAVSAAGCSLIADGVTALVIFRIIGGLGVGILSAVIPTYLSEISPAEYRGTLVSLYQVCVVIGIFVAYCSNLCFSNGGRSWRWMLGLPLLFALVDALLLVALPESPRWLVQKGRIKEAEKSMQKYALSKKEAGEIMASTNIKKEKAASIKSLFSSKTGKLVFLGSMLAVFQQITGINVIINYAPTILESIGIAGSNPLLQTIYIGAANLLFTLIALWLVDKFGRKTLLLCGCAGLVVSLAYLTYAFSVPNPSNIGILIAIIAYIAFFALSLSPLMFVVTSEIYPSQIRGTAMALSTGISWMCSFLVVQFFPWMSAALGSNIVFGIFGLLCLAAGLFIKFCIPETKGKTLEQIQKELNV